jgi:hypothetical protein
MAELERTLAELEIDWPDTPAFALSSPAPAPRRRRPLAVALAVVIAVACAFAVPQSRSAILRFLHLGGERIERVEKLPPAQERSLRASLGVRVTATEAERLLGQRFAVRGVPLYRAGRVVSTLLSGNVLLSEVLTGADPVLLKKYAAGASGVDFVPVAPGVQGIWLHGGRHVFIAPTLPARFAGNTLVWQRGAVTYRLEGRTLTRPAALRLARRLR